MSDREPAKHRYTQLAQLIAEHVYERPFPWLRFSGTNELPHRDPLDAFQAPGQTQLSEIPVDRSNEGIDRLDQQNPTRETGA